METTIFEVKLVDGRIYRVFCANGTQKKKFNATINKLKQYDPVVSIITSGIHTQKQWNDIVNFI